ncbi:MAG: iron-containing redox enzyme family protein [Thermoplasmata archaeon]|uniref:Iron-containing redox enzyme family protein n=1 Tax=Candidatus Sysuiplasma superficiale TaxID=2823368 RepID=A0A8J8CEY0_9ARCH|nr:iron-containing redox enzyme family protein [Candidatus Sysuiplasma superficiale]MBX8643619.1 iron-containing redox enzyme family protein [Candidatus Sysuiplasma superficiale]MCL4347131.1 iron-containing redox enzyme family protein [Candidatus Thermoplasmatota archaeon]MCL5437340.1 iron-containing redox enzyme family protein [Candidatus Thermoplasmatota archaeon]
MKCPVCLGNSGDKGFADLAAHMLQNAERSDSEHVMWLNRYTGREMMGLGELESAIARCYETRGDLKRWIVNRLIERIYTNPPHPFIQRLQHPDRKTIYGYVMEHHHFLVQWVRSCASVISRTDLEDVQMYEIDNIVSEFRGNPPDQPSHHELLLRMGESIGIDRRVVYATAPLPATANCLAWWKRIANECSWIETMAAMHTLELTANPDIKKMGSSMTYFDPAILDDDSYPDAVRNFLYEGYRADAGHSMEALELIEKHCDNDALRLDIQSVVYKTVKLLDDYLMARLERGEQFGN